MQPTHLVAHRTFAWLAALAFGVSVILIGRLVIDLGSLHVAIAVCVAVYYLGFLAVVGSNVRHLLRGAPAGPEIGAGARWTLALLVPLALIGSMLDCMGLSFTGCTPVCAFLMHFVAPAVSACVALHVATGRFAWLLAALVAGLALAFPNCCCANPANRFWIELLGRSPACFASSLGVFLLAATALATRRLVRPALLLASGVVLTEFLFWIGHHYYHVPW